MRKLRETLRQVGKPVRVLRWPDGTRVLLLPHGGRVLGVFAPGSEENFFWTNPAFNSPASAREFFRSDIWHNCGGDRTWLAPEIDLFFPNFPKLDTYFQQRSLDPGPYRLLEKQGGVRLVNRLAVRLSRSRETLEARIAKSFSPAPNPLRHERDLKFKGLQYAGYTQTTTLELLGASRRTRSRIGLWQLTQLPHAGELLIPTLSRASVRKIFSSKGSIPARDIVVTDHLVRYRMTQTGEHKISLRAASLANRMGYLWQSGNQWALVIRNFFLNPSGEYVDAPWSEPDHLGFAVQACNVNSQLGAFSEMEYHVPAIGNDTGRWSCSDESQVWCFRGSKSAIGAVVRMLLTPKAWSLGKQKTKANPRKQVEWGAEGVPV
jgi:hypothetical protein